MSRWSSVVLVLALWAPTYLLFLGSSELRSEEGHRVMPAVQMLESGNYLVPYVGADPYLLKPPLLNWIVAGSFKLCHARNDWSARLPSPLFVVSIALLLLTLGRTILGSAGCIAAALCWLTSLGMIEKGRMIEIEALYVSLFACSLFLWLIWWRQNRSPWLTFVLPWIFLGLGLLAKGPLHVILFYFLVTLVLWRNDRLRDFLQPAHFVGIALMLVIFAAWAIPYLRSLGWDAPFQEWLHQTTVAVRGGEVARMTNWPLNLPRGFAYFLPWAVLLPFIRINKISDPLLREITRALAWGSILPFVSLLLLPGALPRYVLPLLAPFCWIVGAAVAFDAFDWRIPISYFRVRVPVQIVASVIILGMTVVMIIFPLRSITFLQRERRQRLKPVAAQINALMPQDEVLYVINPPYIPYLFYVRNRITYLKRVEQIPVAARYLLINPDYKEKVDRSGVGAAQLLASTDRKGGAVMLLLRLALHDHSEL